MSGHALHRREQRAPIVRSTGPHNRSAQRVSSSQPTEPHDLPLPSHSVVVKKCWHHTLTTTRWPGVTERDTRGKVQTSLCSKSPCESDSFEQKVVSSTGGAPFVQSNTAKDPRRGAAAPRRSETGQSIVSSKGIGPLSRLHRSLLCPWCRVP